MKGEELDGLLHRKKACNIFYTYLSLSKSLWDGKNPARPVIVVGNHVSYLDSIYMGALFPRRIHFMAMQEAFHHPILRLLLTIAGAFPVNREKPELQTMRIALQYLQNGEVVGIFPEGGIREDHAFQELKQGAAYLAVKSKCPIIPIFIDGTDKALPRGRVLVRPKPITLTAGEMIVPPAAGSAKEKQVWLSGQIQQKLISIKSTRKGSQTG